MINNLTKSQIEKILKNMDGWQFRRCLNKPYEKKLAELSRYPGPGSETVPTLTIMKGIESTLKGLVLAPDISPNQKLWNGSEWSLPDNIKRNPLKTAVNSLVSAAINTAKTAGGNINAQAMAAGEALGAFYIIIGRFITSQPVSYGYDRQQNSDASDIYGTQVAIAGIGNEVAKIIKNGGGDYDAQANIVGKSVAQFIKKTNQWTTVDTNGNLVARNTDPEGNPWINSDITLMPTKLVELGQRSSAWAAAYSIFWLYSATEYDPNPEGEKVNIDTKILKSASVAAKAIKDLGGNASLQIKAAEQATIISVFYAENVLIRDLILRDPYYQTSKPATTLDGGNGGSGSTPSGNFKSKLSTLLGIAAGAASKEAGQSEAEQKQASDTAKVRVNNADFVSNVHTRLQENMKRAFASASIIGDPRDLIKFN